MLSIGYILGKYSAEYIHEVIGLRVSYANQNLKNHTTKHKNDIWYILLYGGT